MLVVDVGKDEVECVIASLNHDPHLEVIAVYRVKCEHEHDQNDEEAAASLVNQLLFYSVQILCLQSRSLIRGLFTSSRKVLIHENHLVLTNWSRTMRNLRLLVTKLWRRSLMITDSA